MHQKNIVTIQDIACHGRCSTTIALPILSAIGIQTSIIPTSVLSTHTGGFGEPVITDLSDYIIPILTHWNSVGVDFDCIYSGYLTTEKQVDILLENLDLIKRKDTIYIADPVMGDNGIFYKGFKSGFEKKMLELCSRADIITPNITEACLMTGCEYKGENLSAKNAEMIMNRLYEKTGSQVVLTGIDLGDEIATAVFDGNNTEYLYNKKMPVAYHGAGDIFTSTFTAVMLKGFSIYDSVKLAIDFVYKCLEKTVVSGYEKRNGIEFESSIPYLIKLLGLVY